MAKKNGEEIIAKKEDRRERLSSRERKLHPDTTKSIWGIVFVGLGVIFTLAGIGKAGPAGAWTYSALHALLGVGYFIFPLTLFFAGAVFFKTERDRFVGTTLFGALFVILSVLGLIDIAAAGRGGWLGRALGSLQAPFGIVGAAVLNGVVLIVAVLVTANTPLRIPRRKPKESPAGEVIPVIANGKEIKEEKNEGERKEKNDAVVVAESKGKERTSTPAFVPRVKSSAQGYV